MSKISQISQFGEMLGFSNTIAQRAYGIVRKPHNSANPSPRLGKGSRIVFVHAPNTDANVIFNSVSKCFRKVRFSPDSPIIITQEPKQGEGFKSGIIFSSGGNTNANGILNSVSESFQVFNLPLFAITEEPLRREGFRSRIDSVSANLEIRTASIPEFVYTSIAAIIFGGVA